MSSNDAISSALTRIEEGHSCLNVGDGPERCLYAVKDLYDHDRDNAELILLAKARTLAGQERANYLCALRYLGSIQSDLADETVDLLVSLCDEQDAKTREAAACALSWRDIPNISPRNLELMCICLRRIIEEQPQVLTAGTLGNARVALEFMERLRSAYGDLLNGIIMIPQQIVLDLFSHAGGGSVADLGYTKADFDRIARSIATSTLWLWPSTRTRHTHEYDYFQIDCPLIAPLGEQSATLCATWKVDRRTSQKTLVACNQIT